MLRWFQTALIALLVTLPVRAEQINWGSAHILHFAQLPSSTDSDQLMIGHLLYDSLFRFDNKGQVQPWLVKSWKMLSPTHLTLQLHSPVHFSSGNQLTSSDVLWSLKTLRQHPSFKRIFANISHIRADSADTLELWLKKPCPDLFKRLTLLFVYDAKWQQLARHRLLASGSGPYQLSEQIDGIKTVLTRKRDSWHPSSGNIDTLTVIPIRHERTRFSSLYYGDVDIVDELSPTRLPLLEQIPFLSPKLVRYMRWVALAFNQHTPILAHPEVRQALALAIDRARISSQLMGHLGEAATQLSRPGSVNYNQTLQAQYQPGKAYQQLSQFDNGRGLTLTLVAPKSAHFESAQVTQLLRVMLERLNIEVKVSLLDDYDFQQALTDCKGDLFLFSLSGQPNDALTRLRQLLQPPALPSPLHCALNARGLTQRLQTVSHTAAPGQPSAAVQKLVSTLVEQDDLVPLYWQHQLWGVDSKLSAASVNNTLGFPYFESLLVHTVAASAH